MSSNSLQFYYFDGLVFDPEKSLLIRISDKESVSLRSKEKLLLLAFVNKPNQLLTFGELQQTVWTETSDVKMILRRLQITKDTLQKKIITLRQTSNNPEIIKLVPEQGYIFTLNVNKQGTESGPSALICSVADQPAKDDFLGFKPYVKALTAFLMDIETKGPLTMSIEGEWGAGKSSFMLQLADELRETDHQAFIVNFNAWRYDKEEALWAAFALNLIKCLDAQTTFFKRQIAKIKLFSRRYNWKIGWLYFLLFVLSGLLSIIFIIAFAYLLFAGNSVEIWKIIREGNPLNTLVNIAVLSGGLLSSIALVLFGFIKFPKFFFNPLAVDLQRYLETPNYKGHSSFLEDFHGDFKNIINSYAGKDKEINNEKNLVIKETKARKVFVFIDDLDRCDVPKAAELMQALNLMISDAPQLFFIIGMDREKVAAGLAVKYEKLLAFLPTETALPTATSVSLIGLDYGYRFIEKFIQVPFVIPQPRPDDIHTFLGKIGVRLEPKRTIDNELQLDQATMPQTNQGIDYKGARDFGMDNNNTTTSAPQLPTDSKEVGEVVVAVADFFDFNPRRIKQFLNVFRLKIHIANKTELFKENTGINPYNLGLFAAICLRYPLLVADLENETALLKDIQQYESKDSKPISEKAKKWVEEKPRLKKLFNSLPAQQKDKYSFENIEVNKLLQVSPALKTAAINKSSSTKP